MELLKLKKIFKPIIPLLCLVLIVISCCSCGKCKNEAHTFATKTVKETTCTSDGLVHKTFLAALLCRLLLDDRVCLRVCLLRGIFLRALVL